VNKRDNPHTPGAGRKPPTLAGRDLDLENFGSLIERLTAGSYERSLIYSGLRGVGKTVLLMEFDVLASEAGWATTDVQEVGSQPDFRVTFARMAARLLREISRRHRVKDRVERALGVVKAFSIAVPSGIQLKLDVEAASGVADSRDPEQDLTDLLREIGEVAQQVAGSGALFLIDEMHNLDTSSLAATCIAFQAISRRSLPRRHGRRRAARSSRSGSCPPSPTLTACSSTTNSGGSPSARSRGADRPAATRGIGYEEEAARQVVRESAGYPLLHPGVRPRALEPRRDRTDRGRGRRGRARDRHRLPRAQLLRHAISDGYRRRAALPSAMASLSAPPYPTSAVAQAYGANDQRGVSVHRDALIQKGLIWSPRRGRLDFTVPLFAEYLRDNHPIASFEEG